MLIARRKGIAMIHPHDLVLVALDRTTILAAPATGAIVAQTDPTPLPNWLDGTLAGAVILALGYAVRFLYLRNNESQKEQREASDRLLAERKQDIDRLQEENNKLRQQMLEMASGRSGAYPVEGKDDAKH